MKKYLLLGAVIISAATACAQSLVIDLKDGQKAEYKLEDINSLYFEGVETEGPDDPVARVVKFAVPASFSDSYVYKVMNGNKQVAEVAKEYIKAITKQVVVVYPMGEDGKADLTKGICADNGASVVWDLGANTATVGSEAGAVSAFYVVDGVLVTEYAGSDAADASLVADVLVDKRGTETNTYRIVKIGTQYWTADNLRTIYYTDGTPIQGFTEDETDAWKETTAGAYLSGMDKDWVKMAGQYYNGFVAVSDKIAPDGWTVPTQAEYAKLRTAGSLKGANFRSEATGAWLPDCVCNNMTGFSAVATGSYANSSGIQSDTTEAYFWSTTSYYDALARGNVLDYFRVSSNNTGNTVVSNNISGGHSYYFGHTIRLLRK